VRYEQKTPHGPDPEPGIIAEDPELMAPNEKEKALLVVVKRGFWG
jgi:hypothetical protein